MDPSGWSRGYRSLLVLPGLVDIVTARRASISLCRLRSNPSWFWMWGSTTIKSPFNKNPGAPGPWISPQHRHLQCSRRLGTSGKLILLSLQPPALRHYRISRSGLAQWASPTLKILHAGTPCCPSGRLLMMCWCLTLQPKPPYRKISPPAEGVALWWKLIITLLVITR